MDVVGVVVILAGVVGLLLSLLVRGPLSPLRLSLRVCPDSPDEPGRAVIKEAAAAGVAAVGEKVTAWSSTTAAASSRCAGTCCWGP